MQPTISPGPGVHLALAHIPLRGCGSSRLHLLLACLTSLSPNSNSLDRVSPSRVVRKNRTIDSPASVPCLFHFYNCWESITTDSWVFKIICCCYALDLSPPPPTPHVVQTPLSLPLQEEVSFLLDKEAIKMVSCQHLRMGFYSLFYHTEERRGSEAHNRFKVPEYLYYLPKLLDDHTAVYPFSSSTRIIDGDVGPLRHILIES